MKVNQQPNGLYKSSIYLLASLQFEMYFNPAKLSTVLAFIGAFTSVSAAPTSSEYNVNIRHADDKRVDYNDSYEYDKQDKNAHIEQLKEHQSEIEKQLKLVKQASEKNKFDDNKVGSEFVSTITLINMIRTSKTIENTPEA